MESSRWLLRLRSMFVVSLFALFSCCCPSPASAVCLSFAQDTGFPAGLFLMSMSEEQSVWPLHCIARGERYLLHGLWSPGFPL